MKKTHKENNTKVIIPKEIITYLMDLADTLFEKDYYSYIGDAKLLQKSEMRKNMVMDLIYRGFIYAANYSESHYNLEKPRDFDPFGQTGLSPLATI